MRTRPRRLVLGVSLLALVGAGVAVAVLSGSPDVAPSSSPQASATGAAAPSATTPAPAPAPATTAASGYTTTVQATPSYIPAGPSTSSSPVATDASSPAPFEVLVTYSGWDASQAQALAGAVVSGRVDSDGTCRLDVRQGSVEKSVEGTAVADARTTSCGELGIAGLGSGSWDATVSYRSGDATQSSAPFVIEVP